MVLWCRSVLGCQKVAPRSPRFCQGSTKVGFYRGSTKVSPRLRKFRYLSGPLNCPKKNLWKVPPRFHRGSTKLPPSFFKFRFPEADPFWAAKRLRLIKGSVEGSSSFHFKVSPRFREGFTKVAQVSLSLVFCADPFWGGKRFCGRFPITSLNASPSSVPQLFCAFS